jgi:hypothetical protein
MQIHSVTNNEVTVASAELRAAAKSASSEPRERPGTVEGAAGDITRAWDSVPDVRADAVQRGRELYANVPYPPTEIVDGISRLLTRFWQGA